MKRIQKSGGRQWKKLKLVSSDMEIWEKEWS